jgi:hypothetical protein
MCEYCFSTCFNLYYKKENCIASDACFGPLIIIKFHNLHVGNIKGLWVRLLPTTRKTSSFLFFWILHVVRLWAFIWHALFVSLVMVLAIDLLLDFCDPFGYSKNRYIYYKIMFTCWVSLFCNRFTHRPRA